MKGRPKVDEDQSHSGQPLIKKLTTKKAIKAYKWQAAMDGQGKSATAAHSGEDEIVNIKLSGRGIQTIESLELPSLR